MIATRKATALQRKESGAIRRHRWHQQIAVEKQISHFTTCLRDEQATVTCGTVSSAVAASIIGFVVSANRVVRADR
jgi:hypothetical protein